MPSSLDNLDQEAGRVPSTFVPVIASICRLVSMLQLFGRGPWRYVDLPNPIAVRCGRPLSTFPPGKTPDISCNEK